MVTSTTRTLLDIYRATFLFIGVALAILLVDYALQMACWRFTALELLALLILIPVLLLASIFAFRETLTR